jgi:hypothetical protein
MLWHSRHQMGHKVSPGVAGSTPANEVSRTRLGKSPDALRITTSNPEAIAHPHAATQALSQVLKSRETCIYCV